jgi:hypothetical protein
MAKGIEAYIVVMMCVNRKASYAICLTILKLLKVRIVRPIKPTKPYQSAQPISNKLMNSPIGSNLGYSQIDQSSPHHKPHLSIR